MESLRWTPFPRTTGPAYDCCDRSVRRARPTIRRAVEARAPDRAWPQLPRDTEAPTRAETSERGLNEGPVSARAVEAGFVDDGRRLGHVYSRAVQPVYSDIDELTRRWSRGQASVASVDGRSRVCRRPAGDGARFRDGMELKPRDGPGGRRGDYEACSAAAVMAGARLRLLSPSSGCGYFGIVVPAQGRPTHPGGSRVPSVFRRFLMSGGLVAVLGAGLGRSPRRPLRHRPRRLDPSTSPRSARAGR